MTAPIGEKVAWLLPTMGYGPDLLYWEPILGGYAGHVPVTRIYVTKDKKPNHPSSLPLEPVLRRYLIVLRRRRYFIDRAVTLVDPSIIYHVLRFHPRLIILSEFGMLTIYGILIARLCRSRILLLVESDPGARAGRNAGFRYWLRRFICRSSDLILTNNLSGKRYLTEDMKMPPEKVVSAPYLVSRNDAAPIANDSSGAPVDDHASPGEQKRTTFLYVGRLTEGKGVEYLMRAVAGLSPQHKSRFVLWLVGDGDARPVLEALTEELGLKSLIRFFGKRPYHELPRFYRQADVFVSPTLHDYRGLVGFEAISHGLPVLISKYDGAAPEVVCDGENGFSFDPLDTEVFSNHIAWFLDNHRNLPNFRQRSRDISSSYTVENAVKNLIAATEKCLGR